MEPFLYSIAKTYIQNEPDTVSRFCFVFPNKRSVTFFNHAFDRALRQENIRIPHPETITISEFIEQIVTGREAEHIELLFMLFKAYLESVRNRIEESMTPELKRHDEHLEERAQEELTEAMDFNKFIRWADILLQDFNDVDMYMADTSQMFPNLKDYLSISSNYISDELLEEIRKHWDVDDLTSHGESFWNHIRHSGDESNTAAQRFFKLWVLMQDVYTRFNDILDSKKLYYPGKAYREAVERIKVMTPDDFNARRYIFVGFSMFATAEEEILSELKKKKHANEESPFADFYFDDASPAFDNPRNPAAATLADNKHRFPSLYSCVAKLKEFPRIEVIGIGSGTGQSKVAGGIIGTLYPSDADISPEALRRTAIVLPDENIVGSVLAAIPAHIQELNLTMGYKLRASRAASLVSEIVSLHIRSRKAHGDRPQFFKDDVKRILTHPLIQQIFPRQCAEIINAVDASRAFMVDESLISAGSGELAVIFRFLENTSDTADVTDYFKDLFRFLLGKWDIHSSANNPSDKDESPDKITSDDEEYDEDGRDIYPLSRIQAPVLVDRMLISAYIDAVIRLPELIDEYLPDANLRLNDATLLRLIERVTATLSVRYEGRPLKGLQIMGVLEARGLDFENIIIPSMNENVFPKKHFQKSFIPLFLRSAYGMSTFEHQESMYAYNFYRMISRARRVFLLYDARTESFGGGQPSRYINQLSHLYLPGKISVRTLGYNMEASAQEPISVNKTPDIMEFLERYRLPAGEYPEGKGQLFLSASSINLYINCPLSFYLSYIKGYQREDEVVDYMDASTFGTIVHAVFQDIYDFLKKEGRNPVTKADIESLIPEGKALSRRVQDYIMKEIRKNYLKDPEVYADGDKAAPRQKNLPGDIEVYTDLISRYVAKVLNVEKDRTPFLYISSEHRKKLSLLELKGSDGHSFRFNLNYQIDRIDRYSDQDVTDVNNGPQHWPLRIIDYKTGGDTTSISMIEEMFDNNSSKGRAKAILQLFLYAQGYAAEKHLTNEPIQLWIFPVKAFEPKSLRPVSIDENPLVDYRDYVTAFNDRMIATLEELFNPEVPFVMAENPHACKFCKFTAICRRKIPNDSWG